jgi:chromosome partitioning protein
MTIITAVANQKGGTGKTTTTINLAGVLAERGKRILAVDIDPQGSLGVGWGIDVANLEWSIYDVLLEKRPLRDILISVRETVDLAPANIYLSVADLQLAGEIRREDRLKQALAPIEDDYDVVLIDCPPSLGLLTINALSAADNVLVPMSCDYYALVGVTLLLDTVRRIQDQLNPDLEILGVLPTRYDSRTLHAKEVLEEATERLGKHVHVFRSVIHESVRVKEAPITGQTITEYRGKHKTANSHRELAEEVLALYER